MQRSDSRKRAAERAGEDTATTSCDLDALQAVADEYAKYRRGDRSMLAGEANSAWRNRVTPAVLISLIERVREAEAEKARKYDAGFADAAERGFEANADLRARLEQSESTLAGLRRIHAETVERFGQSTLDNARLRARLEAAEQERDWWKQTCEGWHQEADSKERRIQLSALSAEQANADLTALRDAITQLADEWGTPGEFRGADNNATRADCAKELRRLIQSDTGGTNE